LRKKALVWCRNSLSKPRRRTGAADGSGMARAGNEAEDIKISRLAASRGEDPASHSGISEMSLGGIGAKAGAGEALAGGRADLRTAER